MAPRLHARPNALMPRPAQPEDAFNPGQMNGLQYSRDRYQDGTYQVNGGADPSVTSFMGAIGQAPDGGFINYPTFWDGKVLRGPNGEVDFHSALQRALEYEARTGKKFARYPSLEAAQAGEVQVHQAMDGDASRVLGWPETQSRINSLAKRR